MSYTVTLRVRGKTTKEKYDDLGQALAAIERQGIEAERTAHTVTEGGGIMRKIEPVQQVVARLELSGPRRLRAGVDVRGDRSSEAYTGKMRRELIEQRPGESAYSALKRALGGG